MKKETQHQKNLALSPSTPSDDTTNTNNQPIPPKSGSLAFEALAELAKGEEMVTPEFRSWRLASYVHHLRQRGWQIFSIKRRFQSTFRKGYVTAYKLSGEHIDFARALTKGVSDER